MRFQVLDIVPHAPHPVTGEIISVHERLRRVVANAVLAERAGFDSFAWTRPETTTPATGVAP